LLTFSSLNQRNRFPSRIDPPFESPRQLAFVAIAVWLIGVVAHPLALLVPLGIVLPRTPRTAWLRESPRVASSPRTLHVRSPGLALAAAHLRAFPDIGITVLDAFADGDKVVRRVSFTGSHRGAFLGIAPTGRQIQVEGTVILRITGGKIAEEWMTENLLGLLQQLGAVPNFELDASPV
jgi:hypothetical protein